MTHQEAMEAYQEYADIGGTDGLDEYEYWIMESAAMKSAEQNYFNLGGYYEPENNY